jgi:Gly-Xaa carboxypeptidase
VNEERLEPSPITPTTPETVGWQVLAGTIKGVHASRKGGDELAAAKKDEEDIIVSPSIMSGNTDTRFYW